MIDSGISEYYGGYLSSLLVEDEKLTTIQRGQPITIPESNDELITYFENVLNLEPESTNLKILIDNLKNPSVVPDQLVEPSI